MNDDPYLGWTSDHVGKLVRLQTAVRILAEGRWKTANRLEKATYALVGLLPRDFPGHLQGLASRVLGLRGKLAAHVGDYTYFKFGELKPSEKDHFVADIIALYEACLIDLGRTWPMWDFMYPQDRLLQPKSAKTQRGR